MPSLKTKTLPISAWFKTQEWKPHQYQQAAWDAFLAGKSGLIYVPTGMGKTYAAFGGPLTKMAESKPDGLFLLYITPLRSVSRDIELALERPIKELGLPITLESRTGDTKSALKARQRKRLPNILITTPESLAVLLTREDAQDQFANLKAIIVDEWHELLASKRGSLLELSLARLSYWSPNLQIWGLSATLANTQQAAQTLVGMSRTPKLISIDVARTIHIETLIPPKLDSFPWAGHLGLTMLESVLNKINIEHSALIFTNTRSQTERWYQAIIEARPEWSGLVALHHGSMDKKTRAWVENGVKTGVIKVVVCTSSLDLGVDFPQVETVFQLGSPKGISRLIQRAGRAFHRPGAACNITCIPTHAFELLEFAAVRTAIAQNAVEPREPINKPMDVLMQHMMTCAMGGGFVPEDLFDEIRQAVSFANLTWEEFNWILTMLRDGGQTLSAYPAYHKIDWVEGRYRVTNIRAGRLHRLNIGTISSNASISLAFLKGKDLGTIEEGFISKLKKGDVFMFAGRSLELVMMDDKKAYVRLSKKKTTQQTNWQGSRMPLSTMLSAFLRETFEAAHHGHLPKAEQTALKYVLEAQAKFSAIPDAGQILAELTKTREGIHLFFYPFETRSVHEGLGAILALRMARKHKATFSMSLNDYGIGFTTHEDFPFEEILTSDLFSPDNLEKDIAESVNLTKLAKRQFRDVARIAGLVASNYPGQFKTGRQLQVSASLIFEVFEKYDPENLLLEQARREVLFDQFELTRLKSALERLQHSQLLKIKTKRPSPLGFPLLIEQIGARLSTETLHDRIERMKQQWSKV